MATEYWDGWYHVQIAQLDANIICFIVYFNDRFDHWGQGYHDTGLSVTSEFVVKQNIVDRIK